MTVNMFTILYCISTYKAMSVDSQQNHKNLKAFVHGFNRKYISGLKGLSTLNPFLAASMAVTLLSMAGVPPLAGFVAKLSVYMAVLDSGALMPAIFAGLCSVITAVYYLRVIKIAFFYKKTDAFSGKETTRFLNKNTPDTRAMPYPKVSGVVLAKTESLPLTHFSSIVISLSTLMLIFFPILKRILTQYKS